MTLDGALLIWKILKAWPVWACSSYIRIRAIADHGVLMNSIERPTEGWTALVLMRWYDWYPMKYATCAERCKIWNTHTHTTYMSGVLSHEVLVIGGRLLFPRVSVLLSCCKTGRTAEPSSVCGKYLSRQAYWRQAIASSLVWPCAIHTTLGQWSWNNWPVDSL